MEVGRCYEYLGWLFLVVERADNLHFRVLCLTDFNRRAPAGSVVYVWHSSHVAERCEELT